MSAKLALSVCLRCSHRCKKETQQNGVLVELTVSRRCISSLCRNSQKISTVKHGRELLDECIWQRQVNLPRRLAVPHAWCSVAIMDNSSGEGREDHSRTIHHFY